MLDRRDLKVIFMGTPEFAGTNLKALIDAGYNYDEVQKKANNLLNPKPRKKSDTTIAKEVIQGKWGNGATRKKRLTDAGYNYYTIQSIVNRLLK